MTTADREALATHLDADANHLELVGRERMADRVRQAAAALRAQAPSDVVTCSERLDNLVSLCANQRDIFPDAETALACIVEEVFALHDVALSTIAEAKTPAAPLAIETKDLGNDLAPTPATLAEARAGALEEAAMCAEMDVDCSRFGKAGIDQWDDGNDASRDYRLGIATGRAIAAAIRSLKDRG